MGKHKDHIRHNSSRYKKQSFNYAHTENFIFKNRLSSTKKNKYHLPLQEISWNDLHLSTKVALCVMLTGSISLIAMYYLNMENNQNNFNTPMSTKLLPSSNVTSSKMIVNSNIYKTYDITAIVHQDAFGITYEPRSLNVSIPTEWNNITKDVNDALTDLISHYLQVRWYEQYKNCVKKTQPAIYTITLSLHAIEDVKKAIKHDQYCHDQLQLSKNILNAHVDLQNIQAQNNAQWDKEHPIILDEGIIRENSNTQTTGIAMKNMR